MEIIGRISLVGSERTFPTKNEYGQEELCKAQDFKLMSGKNGFICSAIGKTCQELKDCFGPENSLYRVEITFSVRERETQNHEKFFVQNVTVLGIERLI